MHTVPPASEEDTTGCERERRKGANAKDSYGFTGAITIVTHFCVNKEVTVEGSSAETDQP